MKKNSLSAQHAPFSGFIARGQQWRLDGIHGSGVETAASVFRDEVGNTYVAGTFSDTLAIGAQHYLTQGNYDFYIVSYDPSGGVRWVRTFGGSSAEYLNDVVYRRGVMYFGGAFMSPSIDLQVTTIFNPSGSGGYTDCMLAAMDTLGNFLWGRAFGSAGSNFDQLNDLDVADDAVYAAGTFEGNFDPGNGLLASSSGLSDACFMKYDLSGNLRWARYANGLQADYGNAIAADQYGNVYFAGSFGNASGLGNYSIYIGSYQLTTVGGFGFTDLFMARYDSAGNFIHARRDGGSKPDYVRAIHTNDAKVVVGGNYYYETDLAGNIYVTNGGYEGFVLSLDTALTPLWSQVFAYSQGTSFAEENFVDVDDDGSGQYYALVQHVPFNYSLYYLSSNGVVLGVDSLRSAHNATYTGSMMVDDSCGSVLVAGGMTGVLSVGTDSLIGGYGDVFVGWRTDASSVLPAPSNIQAQVPDSVCSDHPLFSVQVDSVPGAIYYAWQLLPSQAGTVLGTGAMAAVDLDESFSGAVSLFCTATSGCAVSPASDTVDIWVNATPAVPSISANGFSLTASGSSSSFIWYLDNQVIPNENGNSIIAQVNGLYQVAAVSGNCQSTLSSGVLVANVGIGQLNVSLLSLFPNPATDVVELNGLWSGEETMVLTDLSGGRVLSIKSDRGRFYLQDVAAGAYAVTLFTGQTVIGRSLLLVR